LAIVVEFFEHVGFQLGIGKNTVAEGSNTPARVCTPSVSRPSGLPGMTTITVATCNNPANTR
jgi:hypothetical protein